MTNFGMLCGHTNNYKGMYNMILHRVVQLFSCLALFLSFTVYAEEAALPNGYLPTESMHANWVFSGVVTNEDGERYGYFFQMQKDDDQLHAIAALFDGQSNQLLLLDEDQATIKEPMAYKWHVGRAFLRFNPINDSWIFGLKTEDKKGFNFKVDMLKQSEKAPVVQALRPGVELLVSQTSQLNGHIQVGKDSKEQFVTAKNAWFRQIWLTGHQDKNHPYTGVLCRFNDGSGFYSVSMVAPDALRGAVAGLSNAQGIPSAVSQFTTVKQSPEGGPWHIRIASPSLHLVLSDFIKQNSVIAGFITEGKRPGFCMLNKDMIGEVKPA